MPSLKRLNLCSCDIEDDGIVALVSALEQNTSLQILDLGINVLNERGFVALAESLPNIKNCRKYASRLMRLINGNVNRPCRCY
jgi:Ran GTPase-activating protein (RanGAP) involved in mRNA processing and transport